MRQIIATTKERDGVDTFTKDNLIHLSRFVEVPLMDLNKNTIIGRVTNPVLNGEGTSLSAEIEGPGCTRQLYCSIGYLIENTAFSVIEDRHVITNLKLKQVFCVPYNLHD
jgi:hypothetical protein